jgi:hypothetical protein
MTLKTARSIAGTLGNPSKMPGKSYGLPAVRTCTVGAKLRHVKGSVCAKCYATNGNYRTPSVAVGQRRRLNGVYHSQWTDAMVELITHSNTKHFRWHDSGDLLGTWHLSKIVSVAQRTPGVQHWLPTKEYATVRNYLQNHNIPDNLTIRVSAPMVGQPAPTRPGVQTSTVSAGIGHHCPGVEQGNCGNCRACWSHNVDNVDYPLH